MKVDHFMYAVSSIDGGMNWAEETFGVRPVHGGAHQGLGTRNALLAFEGSYLEIIAPDEEQDLTGTMGEQLAKLEAGGLVTWAAEGDLTQTKSQLQALGVRSRGPIETKRAQPDGTLLTWELLFPASGLFGIPFFIDWMACDHPSWTSPKAGRVKSFEVTTSNPERIRQVLSGIELEIGVTQGPDNLRLGIDAPNGLVELNASEETRGLMFN